MPAQQQRRARLDEQLPEAALLDKKNHAVEGQQHAEKGEAIVGNGQIVVIQQIVRRKRQQRGGQGNPTVGSQPAEGQVGQHRAGGIKEQKHRAGGVDFRHQAIPDRQYGQFDQRIAAKRKTTVWGVGTGAVFIQGLILEQQEVVFGG